MKGKIVLVCMVMLSTLLSMSNVIAQGPPSPPCVFYGYVNIKGKPARDGLTITAVIGGTKLNWTTQTANGTYGWPGKGSSAFEIPSQDPNATQKDGGVDGDTILFYVQGTNISQAATFESGNAQRLDLSTPPTSTGGTGTTDLDPFYAAVIVIAIIICAVAVFWVQRKRHRPRHHKSTSSK